MGAFINKKDNVLTSKVDTVISKLINSNDFEDTLYRPIDTFKWQDASRNEIKKEAISHYAVKFAL